MKRLLVIAGSDSSAGAGLQADLKTAEAHGVYAQTVVTAVTAQDTSGVRAVTMMSSALVRAQIEAALEDIGADAIKIGMLGDAVIAAVVSDAIEALTIPMVLDPVLTSTSGALLLDAKGQEMLKARLVRRAALVAPNLPETEALVGIFPKSDDDMRNAAVRFAELGAHAVLFKGGHGGDKILRDVLVSGNRLTSFEAQRQNTRHTHGTGCTLATAIACGLAQGLAMEDAVRRAHGFVQQAIRTAPCLGGGAGPLGHGG
jgi:hydroxymethylpyrimidine/phosphomethylpyrimidine kinase